MMNYQNYGVEDFLAEESFQQYCSGTDENAIAFWNKVLEQEPQVTGNFNEAVELFNLLNAGQGNLSQQTERLEKRIAEAGRQNSKGKVRRISYRWWAAAAVVLLLASGSYIYFRNPGQQQIAKTEKPQNKNDVGPGGNKAVLTLVDGSHIILDSANTGTIAQQGNAKIIKLNNGELAYNSSPEKSSEVLYNTISTPKGGQYQVVLSDGSKVWLNAASSLKFPTEFSGKERNVELTGEGYFEVAHNAAMPFNVTAGGVKVQVLGTHFNINAYSNEAAIKTTLLEGRVALSRNDSEKPVILQPGQQGLLNNNSHVINVTRDIDMYEVMAWKDGFFEFEKMELPYIMRQIERWYDITVEYKRNTNEKFGGRISRNLNLSNVLHLLNDQTKEVHFKIEGNKVIIS